MSRIVNRGQRERDLGADEWVSGGDTKADDGAMAGGCSRVLIPPLAGTCCFRDPHVQQPTRPVQGSVQEWARARGPTPPAKPHPRREKMQRRSLIAWAPHRLPAPSLELRTAHAATFDRQPVHR